MQLERELKNARDRAIRDYYPRNHDKTYKMPPGLARNVIGIGVGPKIRERYLGELCVHCYVEKKLEPAKIPARFVIQETLEGIQTDVIETGRFVSFQSAAAPGSSIGLNYQAPNVDPTLVGTLGAIVKVADTWYVLGSNHAMTVNGRVPHGTPILFKPSNQFIDDPSQYLVARTAAYVPLGQAALNHVDCALAEVTDQERVKAEFPHRTVEFTELREPMPGIRVARVDETEHATGVITGVNVRMRIDFRFGSYEFDDLVLIEGDDEPFARPGDSGALLVDRDTRQATALVIAGIGRYTIACPLRTAFDGLRDALARQQPKPTTKRGKQKTVQAPPQIELMLRTPPSAAAAKASGRSSPEACGAGGR